MMLLIIYALGFLITFICSSAYVVLSNLDTISEMDNIKDIFFECYDAPPNIVTISFISFLWPIFIPLILIVITIMYFLKFLALKTGEFILKTIKKIKEDI